MSALEIGSRGAVLDFAPPREKPSQKSVLFLPGKGVDTMGSTAVAWTGAILNTPGTIYWVSGGYTDPTKDHSEAGGIKNGLLLINPAIRPWEIYTEDGSHDSWTNLANSREGVAQLNKKKLTLVGTRQHISRVKQLCEERGWEQAIDIITVENVLGSYSAESAEFLHAYMNTWTYRKEQITERVWQFSHRFDHSDSIPQFVTRFSRHRGTPPHPLRENVS